MQSLPHIRRTVRGIGELAIIDFDSERHIPSAHDWLRNEHARFWGMQSFSYKELHDYFARVRDSVDLDAFIGMHGDTPAFLIERYSPSAEALGAHYDVQPGDTGLHVLVAPPRRPIHNFTWAVFLLVLDFLFSDARVGRIVVEPDEENAGIHELNQRAGFVYHRRIELPAKTAWFATCIRADYARALSALDDDRAAVRG